MQKHFLFVSIFEHINFAINEKYSKKVYENPNYCASIMIFQTYKNVFLMSVHFWVAPLTMFLPYFDIQTLQMCIKGDCFSLGSLNGFGFTCYVKVYFCLGSSNMHNVDLF
jgi:hypothetical protein